jgi:hypothetical protein
MKGRSDCNLREAKECVPERAQKFPSISRQIDTSLLQSVWALETFATGEQTRVEKKAKSVSRVVTNPEPRGAPGSRFP